MALQVSNSERDAHAAELQSLKGQLQAASAHNAQLQASGGTMWVWQAAQMLGCGAGLRGNRKDETEAEGTPLSRSHLFCPSSDLYVLLLRAPTALHTQELHERSRSFAHYLIRNKDFH